MPSDDSATNLYVSLVVVISVITLCITAYHIVELIYGK